MSRLVKKLINPCLVGSSKCGQYEDQVMQANSEFNHVKEVGHLWIWKLVASDSGNDVVCALCLPVSKLSKVSI